MAVKEVGRSFGKDVMEFLEKSKMDKVLNEAIRLEKKRIKVNNRKRE